MDNILKDNEVYTALVGQVDGMRWWARSLGDHAEGSPARVDFDYRPVYDRWDTKRDIIGFYHTHPHTIGQPSQRDYDTMFAWTLCFGVPLLCVIEGVDGLNAHWFIDDEHDHITGNITRIGNVFVGNLPDWNAKCTEDSQCTEDQLMYYDWGEVD